MEPTKQSILEAAMQLSEADREALVNELAETLVAPMSASSEIEQAWSEEIKKRIDELDRGEVKTIPGEEVFAEVRALLNDRTR